MPVIEVTVTSEGETRIETRGYEGARCQQATRALELALGLVQSERLTAEFHQGVPQETPFSLRADAGT